MSGLTMGYTNGFYTASSGKKIGDYSETPVESTSGSWSLHGRRPYAVRVINTKGGTISFKFENGGDFINFGGNFASGTLNISPIAWQGSATNATGDVIFMYRGDN